MNEPSRMQIVKGFSDLIHNKLLVLFLEHILPDERVEVDVHVLE